MADTPTTPPTPAPQITAEYIAGLESNNAQISEWNKLIEEAGVKGGNFNSVLRSQATTLGLLATGFLGVKESYRDLGDTNFRPLTKQFSDLFSALENTGVVKAGSAAFEGMASVLTKLGVPMAKLESYIGGAGQTLANFGRKVLIQIDNQHALGMGFMNAAAQAGNMREMYGMVGSNLGNLNDITSKYQKNIFDSVKATGENEDVLSKWSIELTKIPGGLKEVVSGTELLGNKTNILTETINYAKGSQRGIAEVHKDMQEAVVNYGVKLQDALQYTARVSEISEKFGARMSDVKEALHKSTDAFKMFATGGLNGKNVLQSMSETMGNFVSQMRDIGIPAKTAMDMFGNITDQIGKMSIAQKAFLSSTTGGFKDLRGAFQIDEMLGKGDFKGVFDKVQKQIKQMTGPIVDRKDAATNLQAAEQYTKQIQILRQGPLSSMARSDVEAQNLLKMMKEGKTPEKMESPEKNLQDTMKRGADIAATQTPIQQAMLQELEYISHVAGSLLTPGMENLFFEKSTQRGGTDGTGRGIATQSRADMASRRQSGAVPGPGDNIDTLLKDLGVLKRAIPDDLKNILVTFEKTMKSGKPEDKNQAFARVKEGIAKWQGEIKEHPETAGKLGTAATQIQALATRVFQGTVGTTGHQVRAAAHAGVTHAGAGAQANAPGTTHTVTQGRPALVTLAGDSKINVHVTSTCPHCGNDFASSAHADTAAGAPKK